MEELYEILGLDSNAPVKKIVDEVKKLQANLSSKDTIIGGLKERIKERDNRVDEILEGATNMKVGEVVSEVMDKTEHYVGGDHIEPLQAKAKRYITAETEEEKEAIYQDMEAICYAYGERVTSKAIERLMGDDDSIPKTAEARRYKKAEKLVKEEGMSWSDANAKVIEEEELESQSVEE